MQPIGVLLGGPADFAGWRDQARRLLAAEVPPEAVEWRVPGEAPGLFTAGAAPGLGARAGSAPAHSSEERTAAENAGASKAATASNPAAATRPAPAVPRAAADLSEERATRESRSGSSAGTAPGAAASACLTPAVPGVAAHSSEERTTPESPSVSALEVLPNAAVDACPAPAVPGVAAHSLGERTDCESASVPAAEATPDAAANTCPAPSVPLAFADLSEERTSRGSVSVSAAEAAPGAAASAHPAQSVPGVADLSEKRATRESPGVAAAEAAPDATASACPAPSVSGVAAESSEPRASCERSEGSSGAAVPDPAIRHAPTARFPAGVLSERRMAGEARGTPAADACPDSAAGAGRPAPTVPRAFLDLAQTAIRHRDPERLALLYRALWRLAHGEPALMRVATDPDIVRLEAMAKAVRRDAHKMHAFVRFREIGTEDGPRFVSWFEPDHHILEAEAGFFVRRFAAMRWSILTPSASAHWNGSTLTMGPGARRADAPAEDAREDLWRAYYASIFNPARLKPDAMRAEMPVKYWRNLPEARLIPRLIAEAPRRAAEMVERGASAPAPRRQRNVHWVRQPVATSDVTEAMPAADLFTAAVDPAEGLAALRAEMLALNSLPPWTADSTQMVFGEGPVGAPLVFVGEQPGDEEDIAGKPFVGPAGRMFNKALEEAGIPRNEAYVTNAVKHFKFKPTGRRRLHQSPDAGDITYYRPFLKREIDLVGPQLVVTLGATALRALSGKPLAINKTRGEVMPMADGPPIFPTVHPSYLLRLPDPDSKAREYERFIADLKRAHREVA